MSEVSLGSNPSLAEIHTAITRINQAHEDLRDMTSDQSKELQFYRDLARKHVPEDQLLTMKSAYEANPSSWNTSSSAPPLPAPDFLAYQDGRGA